MEYKHLKRLLGKRAINSPNILEAYSYDASGLVLKPSIVLRPRRSSEVKKIIDYANRYRYKLLPRGFGTNNVGGAITSDILIDLSAMNDYKIVIDKRYVDMQPGARISDVRKSLPEGLDIDIYPCTLVEPSIGGLIASGIHSREQDIDYLYSQILEVEAIDGTGKQYVFKDASRIFGTEGTLFIITRIRLALSEKKTYRSYSIKNYNSLIDLLVEAKKAEKESSITAIDIYSPLASRMLGFEESWLLIKTYLDPIGEYKTNEKVMAIKKKLESLHFSMASKGHITQESIISKNYAFEALNNIHKKGMPAMLHYLNGYMHVYIKNNDISQLRDFYDSLLLHSSIPGGHGYGLLKKKYVPPGIKNRYRKLKDTYDYNNILSPGKIISYR